MEYKGKEVRRIYRTIIENLWVTFLSHAASLGEKFTKTELSIKYGF